MGVSIEKITFKNYRQYVSGSITFEHKKDNNLSVIVAKNGTGKTTVLNAITWCLYGKEYQLLDEKTALSIINTQVMEEAKEHDEIDVSVTLKIKDDGKFVEFTRKQKFMTYLNKNNVMDSIKGAEIFTVITTDINMPENTDVKEGVEAEIKVKQYFDVNIHDFYFFDGEQLKDYFEVGRSKDIKRSIHNIAQVTLLQTACDHTETLRKEKVRKLSKESPDLEALCEKRDAIKKEIDIYNSLIDQNKKDLPDLEKRRDEIDEILKEFIPIQEYQNKRIKYEKEIMGIEVEESALKSEKSEFIRKYIVYLNLYPGIKKTLDLIQKKEEAGELPPTIDKAQVDRILQHPEDNCPVCDGKIGDKAIEHLQELLDKLSVSSKTSNYLKEIKSSLINIIEETKKYYTLKEKYIAKELDIEERKQSLENKLKDVNSILSAYVNKDDDKVNVAKLNEERATINEKIRNADTSIGFAQGTLEIKRNELKGIEKDIEEATKKTKDKDNTRLQLRVYEKINHHLEAIKDKITSNMRKEIEITTWNIFDSMIWKHNTFGGVRITDEYEVAALDTSNTIMTGSLGATEQMALAYAFTLAIHEASGKNCPLVIDSPLGRVSDDNRENMAKELLKISKEKQIIMFFTPDEYSKAVQDIYEDKVNVRYLNLTADEKKVEGIDD